MAVTFPIGVHQESRTYLTDAAITTKHLLYKQGSDLRHVAVSDASSIPLGTIPDLCSAAEAERAVLLIGKGPTKTMVCSEAITAGNAVYAAAGGKVATSGTYALGIAMTTTATDGDELEVADTLVALSAGMLATNLYPNADATNNIVIYASEANTPAELKVTASTVIGRSGSGNLAALAIDSDLTSVSSGDDTLPSAKAVKTYADLMVPKSLYDAHTVLYATSDNTPAALTVAEQRIVGRITGGNIAALTGTQLRTITYQFTDGTTQAADALAIPLTHRYVAKTTGADGEVLTIAAGTFLGQMVTVLLVTDGGGDGVITPGGTAHTGFSTVTLADAGDSVTFEWTGSTTGWIIVGTTGLADAGPAIGA